MFQKWRFHPASDFVAYTLFVPGPFPGDSGTGDDMPYKYIDFEIDL